MWQRDVLEPSVSLQAVFEHHMPKTLLFIKTTQSTQTFGSLISPYLPVTTMWTVWSYLCHPSINNYFMPWTLTNLSPAIIWQVRKRERDNTKKTEGEREMPLVWRKPHFQCHRLYKMSANAPEPVSLSKFLSECLNVREADGEVTKARLDLRLMEHGFRVRTINSNSDWGYRAGQVLEV